MRAIAYDEHGSSSVLHLVDRPDPQPGPGEVLVRIAVSGVNPTDWKSRAGAGSGRLPKPQVPNQDGAGIVAALGDGVTGLRVGDRVWVWDAAWQRSEGTAQELALLPFRQVVPLPDGESFDTGASLGIPALTAHRALTCSDSGPSRLAPEALRGMTLLVTGGAGAVSHAAIQLARWAGATVLTTVSSEEKAVLAKRAGAQHIINYRTDDVARKVRDIAPDGVDLIVEVNAPMNLATDLAVLRHGGTVAIYASTSDEPLAIPVRPSMTKNIRYQFILTYTVSEEQKENAVADVRAALAEGALRVGEEHGLPLLRFALDGTAKAHDAVERGAIGKVLIDVATV
jgi:NADPH2:quinone reductase